MDSSSYMYEHDTTALMNSTLDTDAANTPRDNSADEAEAFSAFMAKAQNDADEFKSNRYALGGAGWSREGRRLHAAPPGARWVDDKPRESEEREESDYTSTPHHTLISRDVSDGLHVFSSDAGYSDSLDNYLVEKLNPFSTSHELPSERGFDVTGRIPPLQHTWDPFSQVGTQAVPSITWLPGVFLRDCS